MTSHPWKPSAVPLVRAEEDRLEAAIETMWRLNPDDPEDDPTPAEAVALMLARRDYHSQHARVELLRRLAAKYSEEDLIEAMEVLERAKVP
jgi:hypothetical protein